MAKQSLRIVQLIRRTVLNLDSKGKKTADMPHDTEALITVFTTFIYSFTSSEIFGIFSLEQFLEMSNRASSTKLFYSSVLSGG